MIPGVLRLAAVGLLAATAASCGGSSLPDPKPCVAPTPFPTATTRSGTNFLSFQYFTAVNDGAARITALTSDFRARWPEGTFYRHDDFRPSFVDYAGQATCVANAIKALQLSPAAPTNNAVTTRMIEAKPQFDAALQEYAAAFDDGLGAIRSRNVSDYRSFNRRIDEISLRLAELLTTYRVTGPNRVQ